MEPLLEHLLWTLVGAAFGASVLIWLTTMFASGRRRSRAQRQADLTQDLSDALGNARQYPTDPEAQQQLRSAIDSTHEATIVPLLVRMLTPHTDHDLTLATIRDSAASQRLTHQLQTEGEQVLAGLQLAVLIDAQAQQERIKLLATSGNEAVARGATQALVDLDPTVALDLLFQAAGDDRLWALGQTRTLLQRGTLDAWLDFRGEKRLADVINLLAGRIVDAPEPVRVATIDVLAEIPHRIARTALSRAAVSTSDLVANAARDALRATPSGRRTLADLDTTVRPTHEPSLQTVVQP